LWHISVTIDNMINQNLLTRNLEGVKKTLLLYAKIVYPFDFNRYINFFCRNMRGIPQVFDNKSR